MKKMGRIPRIVVATIFLIISFFLEGDLKHPVQIFAYFLVGYDVLYKALRNIIKMRFLDEFFLMSIATVGALILKEYFEAAEVMLFYQIGESFQVYAANKSSNAIEKLLQEFNIPVHVLKDGVINDTDPEDVKCGNVIIVKPGEKVPIDGIIIEGNSSVNTANLTGESAPRFLVEGDEILSGMINLEGALKIRTNKSFEDSAMMKILEMIENASSGKSKTETFITRFSKVYTPCVVAIALLIAIVPMAFNIMTFKESVGRALMILVISCPCALLISVPLSFFGVIGGLSKRGILIKKGNAIEHLSKIKQAVFDKTGTLTRGVFKVVAVHPKEYEEKELLKIAAYGESLSKHPIAQSIVAEYGKEIINGEIENYQEIAGYGVSARIFGKDVLIGNRRLMEKYSIPWENCRLGGTVVHIAIDNRYQGHIIIADEVKPEALEMVKNLRKSGVEKLYMLTGDLNPIAESVSRELNLTGYEAELLPEDKVKEFNKLKNSEVGITAYVGDGLNDAPVLANANLGISMGLSGAGVSMEEADILIADDKLSSIPIAVKNSKRAMKIIYENITLPIAVKVIVLILASIGLSNMQLAIFSDVGMMILAVLNATRTMKIIE